MLVTRVITALVLFFTFLGAVFFLPEQVWVLFCALVMGAAAWEWQRLCGFSGLLQKLYAPLTAAVFVGLAWFRVPAPCLQGIFLASSCFWLGVVPLWLRFKWPLQQAGNLNSLLGWALLLPAGFSLVLLRGNGWQLLAILMVAWLADTAAYFTGVKFGRHKMAPSISPAKSWEGVAGAVVAVGLYACFLPKPFVFFTNVLWASNPLVQQLIWVVVALVLVLVCIQGDLLESLFKRQAKIKDSSNLLPGHGGVLDRIDSLLALLPVVAAIFLVH